LNARLINNTAFDLSYRAATTRVIRETYIDYRSSQK